MSFLDILGAVEGAKAPSTIPGRPRDTQAAVKKPHPLKQESMLARDTAPKDAATRPAPTNGASQLKRKAEGDLGPTQPKAQRTNTGDSAGLPSSNAKPTSTGTQPYRGTAGLDRPKAVPRPIQQTARPVNAPSSAVQAPTKPAPPKPASTPAAQASTQGKPAPKKGSYAEILARAAATQTTYTGIKHKTTEEIKKAKPIPPKDKGKPDPRAKPGVRRPGSAEVQSGSEKERAGANKGSKPAKTGYQGTARAVPAAVPARPAYQGTIGKRPPDLNGKRPGLAGRNPGISRGPGAASKHYEYYNSEDEEEGDEDDYASDASSDMEANLFDVDREEEEALRAAKKEDAMEAARLAELEREKKRRKQLALAQSIKEKKERRRFM